MDLDSYGDVDTLGILPLFFKRTADVLNPHLVVLFRLFFVCVALLLAEDLLMTPQFRKVHLPL